jgi:hypothetical protein
MHMIRSMTEALEVLRTGFMTFPRPEVSDLLDIRNGKWSQSSIERRYLELVEEVKAAEKTSPLPPLCDRAAINQLVVNAMLYHWNTVGYL